MKRLIIIPVVALFIIAIFFGCTEDPVAGEGPITTEIIDVEGFTGVRLEGISNVSIEYGEDFLVKATGHANIINLIQTDVINGIWHIELESGNYGSYELNFDVVMPSLNSVTSVGTGDVIVTEFIEQPGLEIYLEGTGSYLGFPLTVNDCSIEILGSGDGEVSVNNTLDVVIEGSGNVYYQGSPTINEDISGSGKIIDSN
jgi:hypothetical protein